jgi:uncharacterized damage-inducible protein DinB
MQYDPDFIRHLFDYMIWSDRTMFDAARKIPDAEYYKPREFSAGSIHNLFVHQMAAQRMWHTRWHGSFPTRLEDHTDHPTRELLAERWPVMHDELRAFAARQTRESINAVMRIRRTDGEELEQILGAMMMHVADHGTYHRGQLNSMFKQAGAATAYTPYFRFAQQQGGKR